MKIQGTGNYTTKLTEATWTHQAAGAAKTRQTGTQRFDSVLISTTEASRQSGIHMELRGRLTQEVQSAVTSGQIRDIQKQITDGVYTVEPREIARRMLLRMEA